MVPTPFSKRRLFFALWPEPALQAAMAAAGSGIARSRALGGREIPAARIHLTLLFLGDVDAAAEKRLIVATGRIQGRAFDLTLDQAGCFFRSKVFWLGASTVPRKLAELGASLRAAAAGVGVTHHDNELVPHVTCLRDIRHVIRPVAIAPMTWPVRGFVLVHSAHGPQTQYHVVSHWPLQTAPT